MKGLSEKHKYNKSIRVKHSKHLFERKDGGKLNLCQFEHSHKSKENGRCSVVKMNEFLKNKRLNSMKGFRTLANDKKTQKVVFVNHQGKPLTYRVSRP